MLNDRTGATSRAGRSRTRRAIASAVGVTIVATLGHATLGAAAGGWSITPSPSPPVPQGALNGTSCPTTTRCVAVGYRRDLTTGAHLTLAEAWDGTVWSVQASPNPGAALAGSLSGVACGTATACIAVGDYVDSAGTDRPLAEGWDGTAWTVQAPPSPTGATTSSLAAVACLSASKCIAVGSFNAGGNTSSLAELWNGTSWNIQATGAPAGATLTTLSGVACSSPTACFAVGHYAASGGGTFALAEGWNGSSWVVQPSDRAGFDSSLSGVACVSSTDCTSVGDYSAVAPNTPVTLVERWNGSIWTVQPSPNPAPSKDYLASVACPSTTECIAAGDFVNASSQQVTLVERWNGKSWSIRPTPNPASTHISLAGVACASASECTAVGSFGAGAGPRTLAEHWSGTSWKIEKTVNPKGAFTATFEAVACASTIACMAVGEYYNSAGLQVPLAERWNGSRWATVHVPAPSGAFETFLSGVACPTAAACIAAGYFVDAAANQNPFAEQWNGTSWAVVSTPSPSGAVNSQLNAVSCASATTCTAVGQSTDSSNVTTTFAEGWDGTAWTVQPTPNPSNSYGSSVLRGVSCVTATTCTAVGFFLNRDAGFDTALAESWDGSTWVLQAVPIPTGAQSNGLSDVSCWETPRFPFTVGCVAVGSYYGPDLTMLAERWNGTGWSVQASPGPGALVAVSCLVQQTSPFAVGCEAAGVDSSWAISAERWDGAAWTGQSVPDVGGATSSTLSGVACSTLTACSAVGTTFWPSATNTLAETYAG